MLRKCCAHCPGSVTRTGEPIREHVCSVPDYVAGNLRVSSLRPHRSSDQSHGNGCKKHPERSKSAGSNNNNVKEESMGSCYERFAVAKKFHAENLQHQPLPDRVDDAIFSQDCSSSRRVERPCMCDAVKRCQKIVPRRAQLLRKSRELSRVHKYTPALGCKKPATYMDLAICWETPVDAAYEPRRAAHIDGSDGGPAPAIFALVSHEHSQVDVRDGCIPGQQQQPPPQEEEDEDEEEEGCCDDKCRQNDDKDDLCKHLNSIHIGESNDNKAIGEEARGKRAEFMRHCVACETSGVKKKKKKHQRAVVRSASCLQKHGCSVVAKKNNGLPNLAGGRVPPRPRTPYARRSFCIDTLAPPFSIVHGCRDADYPEHWRLTSIYQQSYRNPRKMREGRTILSYDRRGC